MNLILILYKQKLTIAQLNVTHYNLLPAVGNSHMVEFKTADHT